jgi:Flp pilus assembly protein TadG
MRIIPTLKRRAQRGNAMIEFAIVSVVLTPLLLGTVSLGLNLSRTIQVTQVVRDAGHMYARWVDFSLSSNQQLLVRLAQGLGMTQNGGNGVVILSKITYIDDADCTGAGLTLAQCTNRNQYVILNRVVIGNVAFHSSTFGTPSSGGMASNGDIIDYLRDTSARASNFSTLLTLQSGQFAFVAEGFFNGIGWGVPNYGVGNSMSARSIF